MKRRWNKVVASVARTCIFGAILLVVYLLSAPIAIPSILGLGEIRVLIVSVVAKLSEQGFYEAVKRSVYLKNNRNKN